MSTVTDKGVIDAIQELIRENGGLVTPEQVVAAAKHDKRLHDRFEWDDTEAAKHWRIEQAARLLRFTVFVTKGKIDRLTRVFVSLKGEKGFRATEEVISSASLYRQLIMDAREDMKAFIIRYNKIKELKKVFTAMKVVLKDK
jgi:hypothetical protein